MIQIEFSEADIAALEYERYHHPHPHVQRKMEVLYLKSQGLSHQEIRRLCRIRNKATLVSYLREYEAGGIAALKQLHSKGQVSELNAYAPSLKRSPTQIKAFLKRIGLRYRKVGYIPGKTATPEKMAQQEQFQSAELEPRLTEAKAGERAVFLWMLPTLFTGFTWAFSGASRVSL